MKRDSLNAWLADGLFVAGALCLTAGLWWAWPPAGLIGGGTVLVTAGVAIAIQRQRPTRRKERRQ